MGILKQTWAVLAVLSWGSASVAGDGLPPIAPFMPTDADDVRAYTDLLRRDAETYFDDVERYFQCQDEKRREVFEQARVVSEDYTRVLETLGSDSCAWLIATFSGCFLMNDIQPGI